MPGIVTRTYEGVRYAPPLAFGFNQPEIGDLPGEGVGCSELAFYVLLFRAIDMKFVPLKC